MSQKKPTIDDVILRIHAAPLEPHGWQSVIQDLLNLSEAEKALMLTVGLTPAIKPWERTINFDIGTLQEYASHWASQDLLYLGAVRKGRVRPGLVSTDQELIDRREYSSSSYFNEFLRPNDIEPQLNVCLTNSMPQYGLGPSAITLYRCVGKDSDDIILKSQGTPLQPQASLRQFIGRRSHFAKRRLLAGAHSNALNAVPSDPFGLECSRRLTNRMEEELLRHTGAYSERTR